MTNEQQNIRFHSANPTRQAFNVQRNTAYAQADYTLLRGSFHAADQSGKRNDMNFYFGGLKQLGRIDLAGSLRYENIQARHHAWNSTYGLEPENPFPSATHGVLPCRWTCRMPPRLTRTTHVPR